MEGVILFADDNIFKDGFEKSLFEALSKKEQHPVLPIVNLDLLEAAIKSTSSIKALIVDWNFENYDEEIAETGVPSEKETPFNQLMSLEIFSLIYIYSEKSGLGETESGKKLKAKFNGRLKFKTKNKSGDNIETKIIEEQESILADIEEMASKIENIEIPILWTQVINQAVQGIFYELNNIDKKWMSDLYTTAQNDGAEPSQEIISLFQNLLAERVVGFKDLKTAIESSINKEEITDLSQYARLFRTFIYNKIDTENDPIMTGDIFKFPDGEYGILITPECDIRKVSKKETNEFEFLVFKKHSISESFFITQFKDTRATIKELSENIPSETQEGINKAFKDLKNKYLESAFNQPHSRIYILPSFEFKEDDFKTVAEIDFSTSLKFKKVSETKKEDRIAKLNSPYIQDLRQRYLSYKGRVGVPSFPQNLRGWILNN